MTGRIFLLFSFVFISQFSVAQKEDRNWVFGDSIRIDFNNLSNPTVHYANCFNNESNASISDKNGNLLMYLRTQSISNNYYCQIINSNNSLMENGDSITHDFSATNGALFIPMPDDSTKYYFITIAANLSLGSFLSYSIIDISLNAGLGQVISKNNILEDSIQEKLLAIKHANGRDWWILSHKFYSNQFVKYLITPTGISSPAFQNIGSNFYHWIGESAISSSGNKLCLVSNYRNLDVFDFNRCTGDISNWIELGTPPYSQPDTFGYYGCEFSPNGNRIYVSEFFGWQGQSKIIQYSLNSIDVNNSKTEIFTSGDFVGLDQLELAPDNKIYISGDVSSPLDSSYKYLSVIENPNDSGTACNFNSYSFYLNGNTTTYGLPNMPNYNLGKLVGSPCDTLTSIQNENLKTKSLIRIFPNPAESQLTVSSGRSAVFDIQIVDVLGKEIFESKNNLNSSTGLSEQIINLKSFSAGIYFIKVYMNDGSVEVRKFVKE